MSNAAGQNFGGKGTLKPLPQMVMNDFDQLPPELRAALRDSAFDWPPHAFMVHLKKGLTVAGAVEYIRNFDLKHSAR